MALLLELPPHVDHTIFGKDIRLPITLANGGGALAGHRARLGRHHDGHLPARV